MYYVFNLAFPAIVALIVLLTNGQVEWSFIWLDKLLGSFGNLYLFFVLPHLIWASITSYFECSSSASIGGFIGAHVLLVGISLLIASSNSPEAANGWFLYYFGSPLTIAIGALIGRKVSN